jgi:hypothetical protein
MIILFRNILLAMLAAVFLTSCVNPFNPRLNHNSNPGEINTTPEAVLQTLEQSYRQRNLEMFESCLAPDFRFELLSAEVNIIGIDWNEDGIRDSWWGYDQEVEYHRNLFHDGSSDGAYPPPDLIYLRLQIPPQDQWEADPEVGHESWVVIPCLFDLQLTYTNGSSLSSNGVARFFLKPINNRWYIAVWRDESNI